MNECQYVYRYLDETGNVLYVGITNNMERRVAEHSHDKLSEIENAKIEYFSVMYRTDAELLETYLINHYDTGKQYNIKKTNKGNVSFLGKCEELPWAEFSGKTDMDMIPFILEKTEPEVITKTEVIEKRVYIDSNSLDDAVIAKFWQDEAKCIEIMNEYKTYEETIIGYLQDLLKHPTPNCEPRHIILKGLQLHTEKLKAMAAFRKEFDKFPFRDMTDVTYHLRHASKAVDTFEDWLKQKSAVMPET